MRKRLLLLIPILALAGGAGWWCGLVVSGAFGGAVAGGEWRRGKRPAA